MNPSEKEFPSSSFFANLQGDHFLHKVVPFVRPALVFCFGFAFVNVHGGADGAGCDCCFPAEDVGASATSEFVGFWTFSSAAIASSFRLSFAEVFVHTLKVFLFVACQPFIRGVTSFLNGPYHESPIGVIDNSKFQVWQKKSQVRIQ